VPAGHSGKGIGDVAIVPEDVNDGAAAALEAAQMAVAAMMAMTNSERNNVAPRSTSLRLTNPREAYAVAA
jgi:hypothetical protein